MYAMALRCRSKHIDFLLHAGDDNEGMKRPPRKAPRPRIVVPPIELEGVVDLPLPPAPLAFAEDWPQGTYSSTHVASPRVRNMPRAGYRQVTPVEVVARK